MDAGSVFLVIFITLLPILGCWFGMFAIRYLVTGLKQGKKKEDALKVLTSVFTYISAVVWTFIGAGLGYASYRVFDCGHAAENGFNGTAIAALVLYILQLILYWSWMPIFIKFSACYGIVAWLAALLIAIGSAVTFGLVDLIAGLIFIPYIIYMLLFSAALSGVLCVTCSLGMVFDVVKQNIDDVTDVIEEQTTNV